MRPGWINRVGVVGCGVFYLGIAALVFYQKQLPMIREMHSTIAVTEIKDTTELPLETQL